MPAHRTGAKLKEFNCNWMLYHYYFLCGMRMKITGALVQAQVTLCGIFGGQSGTGMGLSLSTSILLTV
jgi:hypothetical protein